MSLASLYPKGLLSVYKPFVRRLNSLVTRPLETSNHSTDLVTRSLKTSGCSNVLVIHNMASLRTTRAIFCGMTWIILSWRRVTLSIQKIHLFERSFNSIFSRFVDCHGRANKSYVLWEQCIKSKAWALSVVPHFFLSPRHILPFSLVMIFTCARISLALLSLRKNKGYS